jgi:hypothetical protein
MNGQQELNAALHNVVRPSANYYDEILQYANNLIRHWWIHIFTSEELAKHWFRDKPDKIPAEPRVYGAVIKQLQKEGKIRHVGYTKATNKQAHCRPISVWEVV